MEHLLCATINCAFQGLLDSTTEKVFMNKENSTRVYEFATGHKPLLDFSVKRG